MLQQQEARQNLRKLCRVMKKLYEGLDRGAAEAIAKSIELGQGAPSCSLGCTACCRLPVIITKVEAMLIADRIHSWPDWREWPERLANAAQGYLAPEYTRHWYAQQHIPCPFLDGERRVCRIYDVRPAPCRYYYVMSPADWCGNPEHPQVASLDLTELEMRVLAFSNHVVGQMECSCLPLAVLEGMLQVGFTCGRDNVVRPSTEGLPPPMKWLIDCMSRGVDVDTAHDEAVRRSWAKIKAQGVPGTEK